MPMTLMGLDWEVGVGVVDSDMDQEWEKDVQIRVNGWCVQEGKIHRKTSFCGKLMGDFNRFRHESKTSESFEETLGSCRFGVPR